MLTKAETKLNKWRHIVRGHPAPQPGGMGCSGRATRDAAARERAAEGGGCTARTSRRMKSETVSRRSTGALRCATLDALADKRLQNNFSFEAMEKEEAIACAPQKRSTLR